MAVADDTFTIKIGIKNPVYAIISKCDEALITARLRSVFNNYIYMGSVSLQSVVMGPRPVDVPGDWVIDHKNRNKLDNSRANLRWVSKSFNCWNQVPRIHKPSTSRFKGVSRTVKVAPVWKATGPDRTYIGLFHTEREAAIASAASYVRAYGEWAENSDLLVTVDQSSPEALLSPAEMREIIISIASTSAGDLLRHRSRGHTVATNNAMERGVQKATNTTFKVTFRSKYIASFGDYESAVACRRAHVASVLERERQAYLLVEPTTDQDGDAVIMLSGRHGEGHVSKVDLRFWHRLTYKTKWDMDQYGYARCANDAMRTMLHTAVMLMIDSKYIPSRNASIDHINPALKLDNRASNLRVATNLEQQRNKVRRPGSTSSHPGVSVTLDGWAGYFSYTTSTGRKQFRVKGKNEEEVTALLNAKRIEIHGDKAILG
jgi:hypothetical protein